MIRRNMSGYGDQGPQVHWPNDVTLAVNFVINYEEGAELTPYNGDPLAERYGGEFPLSPSPEGMRHLGMESLFEYGSRAGLWRLIRLFDRYQIPLTFFITGFALTQNQAFSDYLKNTSHEIAGHGWRWIDYAGMPKSEEKKQILLCVETLEQLTGKRPQGWYTGRRSNNTRKILLEVGGFLYDSDSYADDCPYFEGKHLIIPYTLECNDFRFSTSPGFGSPNDFFEALKHTFDYFYQEKRTTLMNIGLHPRFSGHPGRCWAIQQFLEHLKNYPDIWLARRIDIARHWITEHPKP